MIEHWSCSTSNEAFHAELRNFFKQIQRQHKSTLKLKLSILLVAKLLQRNTALYFPTSRQMTLGQVLSRRLGQFFAAHRSGVHGLVSWLVVPEKLKVLWQKLRFHCKPSASN